MPKHGSKAVKESREVSKSKSKERAAAKLTAYKPPQKSKRKKKADPHGKK